MTTLLLLLAALAGGAANALAGGGQFFVFPALLWAGVASVKANATSSLAMLPGGIAAAWVYRRTLRKTPPAVVSGLVSVSLAGSVAGSLLLLHTANETFSALVPWLLLISATAFTAAPWLHRAGANAGGGGRHSNTILLIGQFIIAVYGGYFGAGMGVLMIALFLAVSNIGMQPASGIRLLCATAINLLAVLMFALHGAIDWKDGLPMLVAGVIGGYLSARLMRG